MLADLIFTGGPVVTVNQSNNIEEAVAVKENKILFVGRQEQAWALKGSHTKVVNLKGRTVIPGFIDAHIHAAVMGANALAIDCRPGSVSSIEDIKEAIYERTKTTPEGQWIRGWGYNDQYLKEKRNPNRWDLDAVSPHHPVMLTRVCNHISAHNSESIRRARITNKCKYSEKTFTRQNGKISGVMLEEAHMAMFKAALLQEEEITSGIIAANEILLKQGITSIHDAGGYGPIQMNAFQSAIKDKKFKSRLYSMVFSFADNLELVDDYLKVGIHSGFGNEHIRVGPIKLMIDGSSSGPTAATIQPYAIDPGNRGILSYSQELVDDYIFRAHRGGWQITSHAVGDKGVTVIVDAIEKAMEKLPKENCRHRIEHCAMVNNQLLDRIEKQSIISVSNPIFLYEFGDGYIENYGKERAYKMFTLKSFLDRRIIAAGASDCPVTFSDPLFGIHMAVNRKTIGGQVINPDERISSMEALRMFTYNGAYASNEEKIKGSIEPGKLADLVVLDKNFLKTNPEELRNITVDMTIIDGKIEYEKTEKV